MILIKKTYILCFLSLILISFSNISAINIQTSHDNTGSISEWIVDDEGDGDFTSIQQAIKHASDGDTITVFSGTYKEHLLVNKRLSIQGFACEIGNGDDSGIPMIDGGGKKDVVIITAEGCDFNGFRVVNSALKSSMGTGIKILSNNSIIKNNVVKNCFVGISANDISNCEISYNRIYYNVFGLNSVKTLNCNISNNTFYDSGLTISDTPENILQNDFSNNFVNDKPIRLYVNINNTVLSNSDTGQMIIVDCHNVKVENLSISNTTIGLEIIYSSNLKVRNCVLSNIHRGGISLHGEKCEIYNVSFENCSYGCYLEGGSDFYIHHNNFIDVFKHDQPVFSWVKKHQTFMESSNITFDKNYYNNWIGLEFQFLSWFPKILPGFRTYTHKWLNIFPIFKYDWNPQILPYNISV